MNFIDIFEKWRDLPYTFPGKPNDPDYRCWTKHKFLHKEFIENGIESRYRVCSFKWNEQPLPKDIVELAPTNEDYHLFLEVKLNQTWLICDCTFDKNLPRYNDWSGLGHCKLAVIPIKEFNSVLSVKESAKMANQLNMWDFRYSEYVELYQTLNEFFDSLRSKSKFASK